MDAVSLDELAENFTSKLNDLGLLIEFRDADKDDTCDLLQTLEEDLDSVQSDLSLLNHHLAVEQEKLKEITSLNKGLVLLKKQLEYNVKKVPERLPGRKQNEQSGNHLQGAKKKLPCQESQCLNTEASNRNQKGPSVNAQPVKQDNMYYPEIEFLTTDEFSQVPKYLKGRLPYDQVNKFIEAMNKAYQAKYKLLKQKKSSLNDANRQKFEAFKMQETKDTKGSYFIVDDDIKEFGDVKMDNNARSILTILRHCQRCKEVRGGRVTRYVYVDSY